MAKRKAGKKPPARKKTSAPKRPKNQSIPGLEGVRDEVPSLEALCGQLADVRQQMNDLRADDQGLKQSALHEMRKHNRVTYQSHGVELARVPGEEVLRVKTKSGTATAESEAPEGDEE